MNATTAGPDQTVQTTMVNVIANVITAATDQAHTTVTAVLRMPYVTTMPNSVLIRNVSAPNGGQEMTVASIVDHVLQHATVATDQMLTNARTVLQTPTTRLMELVAVVMSGWDLTVHTNALIATRPVRSA